MKIDLIYPSLPPRLDGIGHYTMHQANQLTAAGCEVKILTALPGASALPDVSIERAFNGGGRQVAALRSAVQADPPDWLFLQYNPISYSGRWGFNPSLPLLLRTLKRTCPDMRIGIVVHEAFARLDNWSHLKASLWQRAQLWLLIQYADLVLCTIEKWTCHLRSWFPKKAVKHLPVGSNIPAAPVTSLTVRRQLGLTDTFVLGLFGPPSYSRRPGAARTAVQALLRRSERDVRVLYIGKDGASMHAALGAPPFIDAGVLSTEDVSRHLAAMDLFLAPFRDGVSTRRGSFMAALQHGLAVATTIGASTDPILRQHAGTSFLAAPEDQPRALAEVVLTLACDAERRAAVGTAAQQLYAAHFAWEATTARLLTFMQEETALRQPLFAWAG